MNIIKTSSRQVRVLHTGVYAKLPTGFTTRHGVLVRRLNRSTVEYWDAGDWHALNRAGWALKFKSNFPAFMPSRSWAILAPLACYDSTSRLRICITGETFKEAIHIIPAGEEEKSSALRKVIRHHTIPV